jgi:hypothetical protein
MKNRTNGFLKTSVRILLLAMTFCLPVSMQAMQVLGSRLGGTGMRAARVGTHITAKASAQAVGATVRTTLNTQRALSSFAPAGQARSSANLGKVMVAGGLVGTIGANQVLAQEEPETKRESLDEMYKRQVDQRDKLVSLERAFESLRETAKTPEDWAALDKLEEEIRALNWDTNVDLPKMIGEREKELKELKIVVEKIVARKEAEQVPFERVQSMLFGQQAICKEIYPLQQQMNVLRSKIDLLMKEANRLSRSGQEGCARDRQISQELRSLWDEEHKLSPRIHELKEESKKGTIWEYEQVAINGAKTVAILGSTVAVLGLMSKLAADKTFQLAEKIASENIRRREDAIAGEAYLAGGRYVLALQEARIAQPDQLANEARRQTDAIWNNGFSAGFNNGFSAGVTDAIQRFLGPPPAEPTARALQNPPANRGS